MVIYKDDIRLEIDASKRAIALHENGVEIQKIVLEGFEDALKKVPERPKEKKEAPSMTK